MLALRERQKRNLLATLLLSQGVPMLSGGDEIQRTQHGNNNAYCQDNEISWTSWDLTPVERDLLEFTSRLIRIRHEQPVLRRRRFFRGRAVRGADVKDIAWLDPIGSEMTDESWNASFVRCLGVRLEGNAIDEVDERGQPVSGDTLLMLLNAHHDAIDFTLPDEAPDERWERLMDTSDVAASADRFEGDSAYPLAGRSVVLFRLVCLIPRVGDRKSDVEMTRATPLEPALAQAAWAQAEAAQPTPKRPERTVPGPEVVPEPEPVGAAEGKPGPARRKGPAAS